MFRHIEGQKLLMLLKKMEHNPQNPEVANAYQKLIDETLEQFQIIKETGLDIDFIPSGQADPYKSSTDMLNDLRENNHLWLYPTDDGFGSLTEITDNPLLTPTNESIKGRQLLANDIFRIVHDYFGHGTEGVGFGARGEENAWLSHAGMYSDEARRAMTTETRGQNSWVNYGEYGAENRRNPQNTTYADQKIGLLDKIYAETGDKYVKIADRKGNFGDTGVRPNDTSTTIPDRYSASGELSTRLQPLSRTVPRPKATNGKIRLTHRSRVGGLTTIDPLKGGTNPNVRGGEYVARVTYKNDYVPRSYYGINEGDVGGYVPEGGLGENLYEAEIELETLYDLTKDPDALYYKAIKSAPDNKIKRMVNLEKMIKERGYKGYWNTTDRNGAVAAIFEPLTPKKSNVIK